MTQTIQLSERLSGVAAMCLPGEPMADIGTDHAWLPAAMVQRKMVPRAIASDLRPGPLVAAKQTVQQSGTGEHVEVRLGDGLQTIGANEVASVAIAGMGGPRILKILEAGIPDGVRRLVLAPNGGAPALRRGLDAAGWQITDEALVHEAGHFYPLIAAEPADGGQTLSEQDAELGPILRVSGGEVFRAWAAQQLARTRRALDGLAASQAEEPNAEHREKVARRTRLAAWLGDAASDA